MKIKIIVFEQKNKEFNNIQYNIQNNYTICNETNKSIKIFNSFSNVYIWV